VLTWVILLGSVPPVSRFNDGLALLFRVHSIISFLKVSIAHDHYRIDGTIKKHPEIPDAFLEQSQVIGKDYLL
jgi:hypothetical protein